jgi:hypothetical protein
MFRRAAKDDLNSEQTSSGIEMAKKQKAEKRRQILGNRDIVVQSAKDGVVESSEYFSSRKTLQPHSNLSNNKLSIKSQTDSSQHLLIRGDHHSGGGRCRERAVRV